MNDDIDLCHPVFITEKSFTGLEIAAFGGRFFEKAKSLFWSEDRITVNKGV